MKKTIAAKDLTSEHRDILRAMKESTQSTPGHALTATGPQAVLSKILPDKFDANKADYSRAMCQLLGAGWVECLTTNPQVSMKPYRLSESARNLELLQPADA